MNERPKEYAQTVIITFSDGSKGFFTGKAVVFPGQEQVKLNKLKVKTVHFSKPQELPPDCTFETLDKLNP